VPQPSTFLVLERGERESEREKSPSAPSKSEGWRCDVAYRSRERELHKHVITSERARERESERARERESERARKRTPKGIEDTGRECVRSAPVRR
jgi:RNA-binding motif X-linked protein 2